MKQKGSQRDIICCLVGRAGNKALQIHRAAALVHQIKKRKRRSGRTAEQHKRRPSAPSCIGLLLIVGDAEYSCDNGTRPVLLNNDKVVCTVNKSFFLPIWTIG